MKIQFIRMYNANSPMTKAQFLKLMEEKFDSSKTSWSLERYLNLWESRFESGYKNLIVPNKISSNMMHQCLGALTKAQVKGAQERARSTSWVCAEGFNRGKVAAQYADHMQNSVLWS